MRPTDLEIFRTQMGKCSDYVYKHKNNLYWSMLDRVYTKRKKMNERIPAIPRCGSGVMPTMDIDGKLYACPRWCPFAIGKKTITIGDVRTGEYFPVKAQLIADGSKRSAITHSERCRTCEFEEQCAFCPAGCYAEFGELKRTMHICPITRIQSEAATVYWRRIDDEDT